MNGTFAIALYCHNFNPTVIGSTSFITSYSGSIGEEIFGSVHAKVYVFIFAVGTLSVTITDKPISNAQIVFNTTEIGAMPIFLTFFIWART